jgi:hypothetical protein
VTHYRVWVRTCRWPGVWFPAINGDCQTVFGTREEAEWEARFHAGKNREFVVLPCDTLPVGAERGGEEE